MTKQQKTPRKPAELVCISIDMERTGRNIKRLIQASGYTMEDIMIFTGVTSVQAIYKWYRGKSLPSIETQLVLCKVLGVEITELLVIDGELDFVCPSELTGQNLYNRIHGGIC